MSICCKAIRQIYYNAGSGYTVASYMTNEDLPEEVKKQKNGNYGIFQAFGTELPANEGLDVELTGDWKPTKYGMQYSVSNFSVTMPTTKEGIRTYLSSSLIKGIGPAMAARIVETFGEDTLNVFNDSPEKLLQVKGITQKRLDDILEGYQKSSSIRELMMYLSPFGVTPAKVSKIQEKFGPAAVMIVKEEPFRLCEVHGFGFLTVDQIAVKAKHFRADDPLRIKAAILHIMSEAEGEGHLYLKREDIIERVEKLLNHNKDVSPVSERAIRDTGNDMIHTDGSLVCHDGGFYTRKSFQAELGAAAALVRLHMQTGIAVNVDRILRKIQKEQDTILNLVLRDIANPKRFGYPEITNGRNTYREGDRVMQTKNNDEVANGDIGEVIGIFRKDQKMVMRVDFGDGRVMEYQEEDYWPLTLAYAITVHKAQGSEYPMAILPMLPCFRWMLRRNIFYTAVTRARERFIIVGSKRAIAQAIRTDYISRRNTMFGYRIRKIYEAILEQEKSA